MMINNFRSLAQTCVSNSACTLAEALPSKQSIFFLLQKGSALRLASLQRLLEAERGQLDLVQLSGCIVLHGGSERGVASYILGLKIDGSQFIFEPRGSSKISASDSEGG